MNPETISAIAIGLGAAIGFALRSWGAALVKKETTHSDAVKALIERAENAEAGEASAIARLAASEGRERAMRAELSAHENGYRAMRAKKE